MKLFMVFALAFVGCACADFLPAIELPQDVADVVAPKATPVHPKDLIVEDVSAEQRIVNGWRANEGQFPYQAGLDFTQGNMGWWCGGSLIGQSWILTAAHCTNGAQYVKIFLGSTQRAQARWSVTVGSGNFRQHPAYGSIRPLSNDISLINIPAVGYSNYIRNIALPTYGMANEQFVNHWGTASGWGGWHGGGLPNDLQFAYMQVIDNGACSRVYGGDTVRDFTLCTTTANGVSTCGGDSGGPLVLYGYDRLIGVTSFIGGPDCNSGNPAGFVRVSKYLDWIRSHTGITG